MTSAGWRPIKVAPRGRPLGGVQKYLTTWARGATDGSPGRRRHPHGVVVRGGRATHGGPVGRGAIVDHPAVGGPTGGARGIAHSGKWRLVRGRGTIRIMGIDYVPLGWEVAAVLRLAPIATTPTIFGGGAAASKPSGGGTTSSETGIIFPVSSTSI